MLLNVVHSYKYTSIKHTSLRRYNSKLVNWIQLHHHSKQNLTRQTTPPNPSELPPPPQYLASFELGLGLEGLDAHLAALLELLGGVELREGLLARRLLDLALRHAALRMSGVGE